MNFFAKLIQRLLITLKLRCAHDPMTRGVYTGKYENTGLNHKAYYTQVGKVNVHTSRMFEVETVTMCKKCKTMLSEDRIMVPVKGAKNTPYMPARML